MVFVPRVSQGVHEVVVTPDTAAVLGRAGSLAGDAAGISDSLLGWLHCFDDDVVVPSVAEVIPVPQLVAWPVGHRGELLSCGAADLEVGVEVGVGAAIAACRCLECPQMAILPAESELDDRVQPGQRDIGRHFEPPPDRRLAAAQGDLNPVDVPYHSRPPGGRSPAGPARAG